MAGDRNTMSVLNAINPLYSLSGFCVGLLVGLTGVGGGSLMTPLLILLFGIHPATAVGTDLLFAATTKSLGTVVHGWSGTIDWQVVRRLATGSVPATAVTLLVLNQFDVKSADAGHMISTILGVALLLTAFILLFRKTILRIYTSRTRTLPDRETAWLTVLTGAILGLLVSISSVGAGAIGVTILLLLYPKLSIPRIVGSDIAHAVPLTLIGGLGHWFLGSVDWPLLASLLIGSLPGIVCGSYATARVPDYVLRPALATTLILVGGRLAF
jgi:uncharacterized protein